MISEKIVGYFTIVFRCRHQASPAILEPRSNIVEGAGMALGGVRECCCTEGLCWEDNCDKLPASESGGQKLELLG